ncbi:hypothetical protein [Haloplanus salinus]|uniref:hypothetical protein n=1 Tax=Haloplanus salinus TaxID=1126245 RepID=UPI0011C08360|nr:hypothetical protein [Haloplanus salinus]
MQRRKFIAGVGSLAAGAAAVTGTGAFTSVSASRNVSISVAADNNAYLQMKEIDTPNSEAFVDGSGGRSNTLSISIDETSANGKGVNEQAVTFFDDLFSITNQGTEPAWVWIKSNIQGVNYYNSDDNEVISIDQGHPKKAGYGDREVIQYIKVGEGFNVGLTINTIGTPNDRSGMSKIIADTDETNVPDNNGLSVENSDKGV